MAVGGGLFQCPIFVRWLELNDRERGELEVEDPDLVTARFLAMRTILHNKPEEAVIRLTSLCADFPESAEYWFALAGQRRRLGDPEGCARAAIRAYASNWVFGMPPNGTLTLLQNARRTDTGANDPLVTRSAELTMNFGGTKENPVYNVLRECIDAYLSSRDPLLGLLLNQNYAYMMLMETTAFQARYEFNASEWLARQIQLCEVHLGDSRLKIT